MLFFRIEGFDVACIAATVPTDNGLARSVTFNGLELAVSVGVRRARHGKTGTALLPLSGQVEVVDLSIEQNECGTDSSIGDYSLTNSTKWRGYLRAEAGPEDLARVPLRKLTERGWPLSMNDTAAACITSIHLNYKTPEGT